MPSKNERQGRSTNIFFFHEGSLQGQTPENDGACVETVARQFALRLPPQQMIFHAFTNFQFDFVFSGCGFTAEFRAFDRVPGKGASLIIIHFCFLSQPGMQQIFARRDVSELEAAAGANHRLGVA